MIDIDMADGLCRELGRCAAQAAARGTTAEGAEAAVRLLVRCRRFLLEAADERIAPDAVAGIEAAIGTILREGVAGAVPLRQAFDLLWGIALQAQGMAGDSFMLFLA